MIKKIKANLNLKVFIGIFFLLCCSSVIIYTIVAVSLPDSYKTTMEDEIREDMDELKSHMSDNTLENAQSILSAYAAKKGYEVALVDSCSDMLYYSYSQSTTQSTTVDDENLLVSIVNEGSAVVYSNLSLSDVYGTCVLYIYGYGERINSISDILFSFIPLIFTIILLLSTTGAFLAARLITHPIKKLSYLSQRMYLMESDVRCNLNRNDELGTLSVNLDYMYSKLMASLYELSNRSEQLQIEIQKERIAEQKRKDFFAAVSHELKTPITVLKGEIEGMIHNIGEYKDRDLYLNHTLEVTNEIEGLVKEILVISKMNSDALQCEMEDVNLTNLVYDVYEQYIPLANAKKIDIICDIEEDYHINADVTSFKKVISNIISNAVKYSPEGAFVSVRLDEHELRVENSGVHIEEQELDNIFEPFYRVEQSRNRKTGGTGLGLYIVKTILSLHNLSYEITNTKDGVSFSIYY